MRATSRIRFVLRMLKLERPASSVRGGSLRSRRPGPLANGTGLARVDQLLHGLPGVCVASRQIIIDERLQGVVSKTLTGIGWACSLPITLPLPLGWRTVSLFSRPCTHEGLQTVVRLNRVPEARSSNTNNASSTNPLPHCQQTRFHTLHTLTKTCHNPAPAPQATPPVLFRHDRAHAKSALCQPDPVSAARPHLNLAPISGATYNLDVTKISPLGIPLSLMASPISRSLP